jgi:hypothetical protein
MLRSASNSRNPRQFTLTIKFMLRLIILQIIQSTNTNDLHIILIVSILSQKVGILRAGFQRPLWEKREIGAMGDMSREWYQDFKDSIDGRSTVCAEVVFDVFSA